MNDVINDPEVGDEMVPLTTIAASDSRVDPSKISTKKNGRVRAYAANTNKGIVRKVNEDRVSIILNILKPESREEETWPKCSFFGIFDGHGGSACADFL